MVVITAAAGSFVVAALAAGVITRIPVIPFSGIPADESIPAPAKTRDAFISVKKTDRFVEATGDPIWSVELVVNGQAKEKIDALIGRADRQLSNRNAAGSKSPLPPGTYRIDLVGIEKGPFPDPEVGRGYWVPIFPLFPTSRSFLGLHQDPSWGKLNGESGTSGCIGVKSIEDTKRVVEWTGKYQVRTIVVES